MPLFRRKTDSKLPRTSSLSVYGQGKTQIFHNSRNSEKSSDSGSFSSIDLEDRPHPLAFAEATFDPSQPMKTKSRLSKDLREVLHDNAALAYFIQFMDAQKAKHLVKFWLETESFRISLETKRKNQSVCHTEITPLHGDCLSHSSANVFHDSSQAINQNSEKQVRAVNVENAISFNVCNVPIDCIDSTILNDDLNISKLAKNDKSLHIASERTGDYQTLSKTSNQKVVNASNIHSISTSFKEHVRLGEDLSTSKLSKYEQSSSVDSGCEEKCIQNCLVKDLPQCLLTNECAVNKVQCDKPDLDQGIEVTWMKENNSRVFKDNFIRLETSIEQDAYSIYSKYISCDASLPIGITNDLRISIENTLKQSSGVIPSQCFAPAQDFVVTKMDKEYFPMFLRSSFHCKHQIDVLTSGTVYLADVLYNDSALFFFMEFLEQEGVRHLVDFLLMADNFQKHLLSEKTYDGMEAQADAMVIYEKYFSLQATTPLGFSDHVRYEVEANICREEGPLPDCFLKPVKILTQYLEKTYLLQFLNSQLYFKYISECIIIIQTSGTDGELQQKYAGSDSGSEQSLPVSSVNTLLAMDSKQLGPKIIKNLEDTDMRIDIMQFKPDALWRRPMAGKLQMAHVDHLGRVTVDFEPEPDKRRESRISKAVKKLVNWEEDKNQEDMAWKVAEMIVKDVCSVTMAEAENHQEDKFS